MESLTGNARLIGNAMAMERNLTTMQYNKNGRHKDDENCEGHGNEH